MCEPMSTSTALLLMAGASAASTVYTQKQAANAQEEFNDRQHKNDMDAYRQNLAQTGLQSSQAAEQASEKKFMNNRAAQEARSTALVQAGENGVSGLSVDSLLADIDMKRGEYNSSVDSNLRDTNSALDDQRINIRNNAASRINQLRTPQAPDYLGQALRIGTTYYGNKLLTEKK
ncbi:MAG TPA: hypothetical protein VJ654_07620 [Noviherbaspirillum sp.]|nr:hypothetical protein [Noviherbaspirillum sp.]